jgi:hypothetical protein
MFSRDSSDLIFIKWLLFFTVLLIISYLLIYYGYISKLINNDVSNISIVILLIFIFFSIKVGSLLYKVKDSFYNLIILSTSNEYNNIKNIIQQMNKSNNYYDICILDQLKIFYTNDIKDRKDINEVFEYKFTKDIDLGWFIVDLLIKLGLIGTVIGFIIMLSSIALIEDFDLSLMQSLLKNMSSGMMVALYTTLTGLLSSIILSFQNKYLENIIYDMISIITTIIEIKNPLILQVLNEK